MRRVLPWVVIILLFVLWEVVVHLFAIEPFLLTAPSAIFAAGWHWRWPILDNAWQTFMTIAVGFSSRWLLTWSPGEVQEHLNSKAAEVSLRTKSDGHDHQNVDVT